MKLSIVEIVGYISSFIVMISLLMSSILYLRWVNLAGAGLMAGYGFVIEAWPVFFVNAAISVIDIYYLVSFYFEKEYFKILEVRQDNRYLNYFMRFYEKDIKRFFPEFEFEDGENIVAFTILRNVVTAGIFIGKKLEDDTFLIYCDYVTPEFRGYKPGFFIFSESEEYFYQLGFKRFKIYLQSERHLKYLNKMGFVKEKDEDGKEVFVKKIESVVL
jgi:GNAT superfamily N-acetyltransferase